MLMNCSNEELSLLSVLIALIGELDCLSMPLTQFLIDKYSYLGSFSLSTNIYNSFHKYFLFAPAIMVFYRPPYSMYR